MSKLQEIPIHRRNGICSKCRRPNKRFIVDGLALCARCAIEALVASKKFVKGGNNETCKDI